MTLQDERPPMAELSREEWAARTTYARRRARATQLLARADRDVAKDGLPLTEEEWRDIAAVYLRAADEARRAAEGNAA